MTPVQTFQQKHDLNPDNSLGPITAKTMKLAFGITSNEKAAHFLGQMAHESANFTSGRENLNYSAEGLLNIFRKYFTPELAKQYARKPQDIANRVYANRMGNGSESSGDGWFFRGAGPLQTTGKNNITAFSEAIKDPCIKTNPDLIVSRYYFESALFFFDSNNLWRLCETVNDQSILTVSRAINLGNPNSPYMPNHLQDRKNKTRQFYKWLTS